jgi:hypothetical protein
MHHYTFERYAERVNVIIGQAIGGYLKEHVPALLLMAYHQAGRGPALCAECAIDIARANALQAAGLLEVDEIMTPESRLYWAIKAVEK